MSENAKHPLNTLPRPPDNLQATGLGGGRGSHARRKSESTGWQRPHRGSTRAQPRTPTPSSADPPHRKQRTGRVTYCCTVSKNQKKPGDDPKVPLGGIRLGHLPASCGKMPPAPHSVWTRGGSSRINSSVRKTKLKAPDKHGTHI